MKHFMKHTVDWELRKWGPFHTHVLYMYILIDCLLECCMHIVTVIWRRRNQTSRGVAGTKRKNRHNVAFWKSNFKKVPLNYAIFFMCSNRSWNNRFRNHVINWRPMGEFKRTFFSRWGHCMYLFNIRRTYFHLLLNVCPTKKNIPKQY